MGNRIAVLLVLIAIVVGGYFVYEHIHTEKVDESGDVVCKGCMTPSEKAEFEKKNSGETADGQSERKTTSKRADGVAGFPDAAPVNGTPGTTAGLVTTASPVTQTNSLPVAASPLPQADSELPNAPNGMRFAGTGPYQWYRQGNLTWRLDTSNGRSCIVYATMEEWQKQIVLQHGCGGNA